MVLAGQKRAEGQFYHLHYDGWSNKFNEWVAESEVLRFDRALLEQSAAAAAAGNAPGDTAGRLQRRLKAEGTSPAAVAAAAPAAEPAAAAAAAALAVELPQQLRLHIPPQLKKVVLDDSHQVCSGGSGGGALARHRW